MMSPLSLRRISQSCSAGFTLIEVVIVILILAVLATLALPSLFQAVEFSRSNEALNTVTVLKSSIDRCFLMNNQTYTNCSSFSNLDVTDPGSVGQSHFTYGITTAAAGVYTVLAVRKTVRGGVTTSTISYVVTPTGVTKSGTSAFAGIQ